MAYRFGLGVLLMLLIGNLGNSLVGQTGSESGIGDGSESACSKQEEANERGVDLSSRSPQGDTEEGGTEAAEGFVLLRVEFKSDGEIGRIEVVKGLPHGLTENAVSAARRIKFSPPIRKGKPYDVTKIVKFTFTSTVWPNEVVLKQQAEIIEQPEPLRPQGPGYDKISGRVVILVELLFSGEVRLSEKQENSEELPDAFVKAAMFAASEIKFNPALKKNGDPISTFYCADYTFEPVD